MNERTNGWMDEGATPWYWPYVSAKSLWGGRREMEHSSHPLTHVWHMVGPSKGVPGASALRHGLMSDQSKCCLALGGGYG